MCRRVGNEQRVDDWAGIVDHGRHVAHAGSIRQKLSGYQGVRRHCARVSRNDEKWKRGQREELASRLIAQAEGSQSCGELARMLRRGVLCGAKRVRLGRQAIVIIGFCSPSRESDLHQRSGGRKGSVGFGPAWRSPRKGQPPDPLMRFSDRSDCLPERCRTSYLGRKHEGSVWSKEASIVIQSYNNIDYSVLRHLSDCFIDTRASPASPGPSLPSSPFPSRLADSR